MSRTFSFAARAVRDAALLAAAAAGSSSARANQYYVDAAATPGGSGASWATAFDKLEDALTAASLNAGHDDVWVAEGTYFPPIPALPANPRDATFEIPDDTTVIGGFLGTETSLPPLGLARNTVLDGDIGTTGVTSDNCFHVVHSSHGAGLQAGIWIERFLVRNGNCDTGHGGGISLQNAAATIVDTIVQYNLGDVGAGLYTNAGKCNLVRCTFLGNVANLRGGAIAGITSFIDAHNCSFLANSAANGGAVLLNSSPVSMGEPLNRFQNCRFNANTATGDGGAVWIRASNNGGVIIYGAGTFINCTFANNDAGNEGGAIMSQNAGGGWTGISKVRNCVVWGNTATTSPSLGGATHTVEYSDVEGGYAGTGNINADPLYGTAQRLTAGSPAIDAANNALVFPDIFDLDGDSNTTEPVPFDLDNRPRFYDDPMTADTGAGTAPIVDMGCYEWRG